MTPHLPANDAGPAPKRPPPFSLRLTDTERMRLLDDAAGTPLGTYIKAKVLGGVPPVRMRRSGLPVADRKALARVLALLGSSRVPNNLNQLAHAANIGTLPVTPETVDELHEALRFVRELRGLLLDALGLKPEDAS
jgi:hypothetical protein